MCNCKTTSFHFCYDNECIICCDEEFKNINNNGFCDINDYISTKKRRKRGRKRERTPLMKHTCQDPKRIAFFETPCCNETCQKRGFHMCNKFEKYDKIYVCHGKRMLSMDGGFSCTICLNFIITFQKCKLAVNDFKGASLHFNCAITPEEKNLRENQIKKNENKPFSNKNKHRCPNVINKKKIYNRNENNHIYIKCYTQDNKIEYFKYPIHKFGGSNIPQTDILKQTKFLSLQIVQKMPPLDLKENKSPSNSTKCKSHYCLNCDDKNEIVLIGVTKCIKCGYTFSVYDGDDHPTSIVHDECDDYLYYL